MDERTIKRLLIIVVASIIAIVLLKMGLTKTYTTLNKVVAEKKQTVPAKPSVPMQEPTPPAADAVIIETPATSSVTEVTAVDSTAASSVSDAQ